MRSCFPRGLPWTLLLAALLATVLQPQVGGAALPSAAAQFSEQVLVTIEEPQPGQTVAGEIVVRGWALDLRATDGPGIRETRGGIQVWMDRRAGAATGQLLGDATYGAERPDVAAARGERFRRTGFSLTWDTCLVPTGRHSLQVFAESAVVSPQFGFAQVDVVVAPCPAAAQPAEIVGSQALRADPACQALLQRTSELRGLAPRAEIYRAPLTPETFNRRFEAEFAQYYQSFEVDTSRLLLVAFGLLDPGFNLADTLRAFQRALPLGMYDVDTKVLFVSRDPPDSPLASVTMAHEITHALQDQHYDLSALLPTSTARREGGPQPHPDAQRAIRALVEGDALLVQQMYQATTIHDPAELQRLADEQAAATAAIDFARVPYVVLQSTYFPYIYGPQFIYDVLGAEPLTTYGQYGPAVDALFRRPPTSTSQILHPERYLVGVEPVPVALPDLSPLLGEAWVPLGEGMLGELDHRLILEHFLRAVDPELAVRASSGWTGDRSAVYRQLDDAGEPLGDVAVVLKTRWASPADAAAWADAYAATVLLRFGDPERYAGRTDQLVHHDLGAGRRAWEMPGERAIALSWDELFSVIAIAPELDLAQHLAAFALESP